MMTRVLGSILIIHSVWKLIMAGEICTNKGSYIYEDATSSRTFDCRTIRQREKHRISFCLEDEVRENCPQTCGICCEDDPTYKFETTYGDDKDCDWLARKDIRKYRGLAMPKHPRVATKSR